MKSRFLAFGLAVVAYGTYVTPRPVAAQQVADTTFRPPIEHPA